MNLETKKQGFLKEQIKSDGGNAAREQMARSH